MDPFSITVGTLGLIGAVNATITTVRKLTRLKDVPEELYQLSNELSDLEATIAKTNVIVTRLKTDPEAALHIATIVKVLDRAEKPVTTLNKLVQRITKDMETEVHDGDPTKFKFSKRAWLKKQGEVKKLQHQVKNIRESITRELTSLVAWTMVDHIVTFRSSVDKIRFVGPESTPRLVEHMVPDEQISSDLGLTSPGDDVSHISATTTCLLVKDGDIDASSNDRIGSGVAVSIPVIQERGAKSRSIIPTLQMTTTTFATKPCSTSLCTCKCHQTSRLQPLAWVSQVFGTLFIGYSGTVLPFLGEIKCTEKFCKRSEQAVVKATYYFPDWTPFASRMISFRNTWSTLDVSELYVKFPRVVPASSDIFILAQQGNIPGVQRLFMQKKASVFDVNSSEGRSALHFALTANQPEMARFLIQQKADLRLEDKYSLSPVDTLWNYLLEGSSKPEHVAFRDAFYGHLDATEDLQKRNFSHIHLIVFGFSRIDLDDYLSTTSADIDIECSFGRTPLCWASQSQSSYKTIQILISHGASIHLADMRGQTPLHLAAETGDYKSLKIILWIASKMTGPNDPLQDRRQETLQMNLEEEDGLELVPQGPADPSIDVTDFCRTLIEAVDYKGRSALHFAARMDNVRHASLLLHYGANADHPDSVNRTPLFIALYWNHTHMVQLLLRFKARLDIVDNNKMTFLHYAAKFCKLPTLKVLSEEITSRIIPDFHDAEGHTPLETFLNVRPLMLEESEKERTDSLCVFETLLGNSADNGQPHETL